MKKRRKKTQNSQSKFFEIYCAFKRCLSQFKMLNYPFMNRCQVGVMKQTDLIFNFLIYLK